MYGVWTHIAWHYRLAELEQEPIAVSESGLESGPETSEVIALKSQAQTSLRAIAPNKWAHIQYERYVWLYASEIVWKSNPKKLKKFHTG